MDLWFPVPKSFMSCLGIEIPLLLSFFPFFFLYSSSLLEVYMLQASGINHGGSWLNNVEGLVVGFNKISDLCEGDSSSYYIVVAS